MPGLRIRENAWASGAGSPLTVKKQYQLREALYRGLCQKNSVVEGAGVRDLIRLSQWPKTGVGEKRARIRLTFLHQQNVRCDDHSLGDAESCFISKPLGHRRFSSCLKGDGQQTSVKILHNAALQGLGAFAIAFNARSGKVIERCY